MYIGGVLKIPVLAVSVFLAGALCLPGVSITAIPGSGSEIFFITYCNTEYAARIAIYDCLQSGFMVK